MPNVQKRHGERIYKIKGFADGGLVGSSSTASTSVNDGVAARAAEAMKIGDGGALKIAPTSTGTAAATATSSPPVAAEPGQAGGREGVEPAAAEHSSGNTSEGLGKEAVEGNPGGASVNYSRGGPIKAVRGKPFAKEDGVIGAQKGEFVVRREAVKKIGVPALKAINHGDMRRALKLYGESRIARG